MHHLHDGKVCAYVQCYFCTYAAHIQANGDYVAAYWQALDTLAEHGTRIGHASEIPSS